MQASEHPDGDSSVREDEWYERVGQRTRNVYHHVRRSPRGECERVREEARGGGGDGEIAGSPPGSKVIYVFPLFASSARHDELRAAKRNTPARDRARARRSNSLPVPLYQVSRNETTASVNIDVSECAICRGFNFYKRGRFITSALARRTNFIPPSSVTENTAGNKLKVGTLRRARG